MRLQTMRYKTMVRVKDEKNEGVGKEKVKKTGVS